MDLVEMNKLAERIADLRAKEAEASNVKRQITAELELEESKMIEALQEHGLTKFSSPYGLLSISFRTSVKTPKTPEDREAFFNFLKSLGQYDNMISVNSMTLNSFYKEQFEMAAERGDVDFKIPGLNEVTINPTLSFRGGK